jgi:hypothetical protein
MIARTAAALAPEWSISEWFNTDHDLSLDELRGNVIAIETFQMLCPGCVSYGLPQAQRIQQIFGGDITVVGIHTVFEHHDAMTPVSLGAFLAEYNITFPVGVDSLEPGNPAPVTMRRYQLVGTPSLVLVDRAGRIRGTRFGQHDELTLGANIGRLLDEPTPDAAATCDPNIGCIAPIDPSTTETDTP